MTFPPEKKKTKASLELVDRISMIDEPLKPDYGVELDKFGATVKMDPAEIALVKKVDLYMMVSVADGTKKGKVNNPSQFCGSCIS
jgi:hypothetical protein